MGNWVEDRARDQAIYRRDKGELWRQFVDCVNASVDTANRIYGKRPGDRIIQVAGCPTGGNSQCVRVRLIGLLGEPDKFIEIRFDESKREIFGKTLRLRVAVFPESGLCIMKSEDDGEVLVGTEDACRFFVEPFLDSLGLFAEPLNTDGIF